MRYGARVEYDGTDFAGSQIQTGRRTVLGEFEAALARISGGVRVPVDAAGRTDAGVHARGQVVAFSYPGRLDAVGLHRSLDALLPDDLAVVRIWRAPDSFRPRAAARLRWYRYTVWNGPRSPLRERYALGIGARLDLEAMEQAASLFTGRHDFSAFGGAHHQPVRTLHRVRLRRRGPSIMIDVVGDAFLRHMVRRIVAALLLVGRGEATPDDVAEALGSSAPAFAGATAPAHGLCLEHVTLTRNRVATRRNGT